MAETNNNKDNNHPYSDKYKEKNKELFDKTNQTKSNNVNGRGNKGQSYNGFGKIEKEVKRDIKKLERYGERELHNLEETLHTKRARKIERWIVIIAYVVVLSIAAYFLIASFWPNLIPGANIYTIKASDSKIFNTLNSFYIDDQSVLGDKFERDGEILRPIISPKKFNLVFAPKENIKEQNATLELNFVFNNYQTTNIYLDDNLIFPNLKDYELIQETSTDYIYVRKDVSSYVKDSLVKSDDTEGFVYQNFPGSSVWSTRKLNIVTPEIQDYKQEDTLIKTTIRDDLKLAVYAENNLKIDFTKQDLNLNIGQDEYNVTITNSLGEILFNELYGDDGDKLDSGKIGLGQYFTIKLDNLPKGIYYINFIRDDYNLWEDSTLKDIKINSNKILILGTFLPWSEFDFYKEAYADKTIKFISWWGNKVLLINNQNLTLSKNGEYYSSNLIVGENTIKNNEGKIWITNDILSISKQSWFDIPLKQEDAFKQQEIVIISKENYNQENNEFNYNTNIALASKTTKINLRVLDPYIVNLKEIKLVL